MQHFTSAHRACKRPLILLAALLASCAVALASPRSEAWNLRRSNPTEAASQLESITRNDPSDAKAFWFLTLIYKDLNRDDEALRALDGARRADPGSSFATADSISKTERSLRRGSGGSSSTSASDAGSPSVPSSGGTRTQGTAGLNQQEIAQALQTTGVYVSPGMASQADAGALAQAVQNQPDGAKVIVLDALPRGASIGRGARSLHDAFNMGKGLLVLATGSPREVAAYGGSRVSSQAELNAIVQANVGTFNAQGYTQGIIGILNQHAEQEGSSSKGANTFLFLLVGVPAGAGYLLWKRAKKGRADREAQLREETRELANKLAPAYEKLDSEFEFAIVAQTDPAKQKELRQARAQAGEAFSSAMKQLNNATEANSLTQARSSLLYARDSIENANAVLEGKPAPHIASNSPQLSSGGSGGQMAQPPGFGQDFDVAPLGTSYPGARPGYALDFFTSQPTAIADMVPVEINVNGQKQRVWASRDSAQRALSGQPQVASVQQGGQMVPWYNAPQQYNPWNNFGSNLVQMIAMNAVINSIFQPSQYHVYSGPDYYGYNGSYYGGGYGGYSGGYDSGYNAGYSSGASENYNAAPDNGGAGVASLDLFGNNASSSSANDNSSSSLDMFGGGSSGGSDSS